MQYELEKNSVTMAEPAAATMSGVVFCPISKKKKKKKKINREFQLNKATKKNKQREFADLTFSYATMELAQVVEQANRCIQASMLPEAPISTTSIFPGRRLPTRRIDHHR